MAISKKVGPKKVGPKKAGPKKASPKKASNPSPKKASKPSPKKAGPKKASPKKDPKPSPKKAPKPRRGFSWDFAHKGHTYFVNYLELRRPKLGHLLYYPSQQAVGLYRPRPERMYVFVPEPLGGLFLYESGSVRFAPPSAQTAQAYKKLLRALHRPLTAPLEALVAPLLAAEDIPAFTAGTRFTDSIHSRYAPIIQTMFDAFSSDLPVFS